MEAVWKAVRIQDAKGTVIFLVGEQEESRSQRLLGEGGATTHISGPELKASAPQPRLHLPLSPLRMFHNARVFTSTSPNANRHSDPHRRPREVPDDGRAEMDLECSEARRIELVLA